MVRKAPFEVPDPAEIGGLPVEDPHPVSLFEERPCKVGSDETMGPGDEDPPDACHGLPRSHPYFLSHGYPIPLSKGSSRSISDGSWGMEAQFATMARSFPRETKPFTTPGGTFTRT